MNIKLEHAFIIDDKISSFAQAFMEIFNFFVSCVTFFDHPVFLNISHLFLFIHFRNDEEREEIAISQYNRKKNMIFISKYTDTDLVFFAQMHLLDFYSQNLVM